MRTSELFPIKPMPTSVKTGSSGLLATGKEGGSVVSVIYLRTMKLNKKPKYFRLFMQAPKSKERILVYELVVHATSLDEDIVIHPALPSAIAYGGSGVLLPKGYKLYYKFSPQNRGTWNMRIIGGHY